MSATTAELLLSQLETFNTNLLTVGANLSATIKALKENSSVDVTSLEKITSQVAQLVLDTDAFKARTAQDIVSLNKEIASLKEKPASSFEALTARIVVLEKAQAQDDVTRALIRSEGVAPSDVNKWVPLFTSKPLLKYGAATKASIETAVFFSRTDSLDEATRSHRKIRVLFGASRESAVDVVIGLYSPKTPTLISVTSKFDLGASKIPPTDNPKFFVEVNVADTRDIIELLGFSAITI